MNLTLALLADTLPIQLCLPVSLQWVLFVGSSVEVGRVVMGRLS